MFEGILGIKKPIFGLDIGHETLKIIELKGKGRGTKLLGAAEVPIDPGMLSKNGVHHKDKLAGYIKQALQLSRPHRISARIVSSALPESLVFTKTINLPQMNPAEIAKNIPHKAQEFFPIPIEETYLDWHITGENQAKKQLEILVVATSKVLVNGLTETINSLGLELMGLENKPISVSRALIAPWNNNSYLICDIGAEISSLTCYSNQMIKFTSTINTGGDALKQDFNTSIETLGTEILNLIKFYQNRAGRVGIFQKIILCGGGSNIAEVPTNLAKLTKMETLIGLPWINLKVYDPRFATAIGLAMKEI